MSGAIDISLFGINMKTLLCMISLFGGLVSSQVCSPPGQLCASTSDCCRGCCEQYTCVERAFSCSPDLAAVESSASCRNYFCPPGQICYLQEMCSPESPCPRRPYCRSIYSAGSPARNNGTRNGASVQITSVLHLIFVCTLALINF